MEEQTQKEFEGICDVYAEPLDSIDREFYCLREKEYMQTEIAKSLGHKKRSAVTKRF